MLSAFDERGQAGCPVPTIIFAEPCGLIDIMIFNIIVESGVVIAYSFYNTRRRNNYNQSGSEIVDAGAN